MAWRDLAASSVVDTPGMLSSYVPCRSAPGSVEYGANCEAKRHGKLLLSSGKTSLGNAMAKSRDMAGQEDCIDESRYQYETSRNGLLGVDLGRLSWLGACPSSGVTVN
jgi:hypothetical protein